MRRHISFEVRPNRRQVEARPLQMRMRRGELHAQRALGSADIGEALVIAPRKLAPIAAADWTLMPVMVLRKLASCSGWAYSSPNRSRPCLTSFCGSPVRSAAVRAPQNGYSLVFAISSM